MSRYDAENEERKQELIEEGYWGFSWKDGEDYCIECSGAPIGSAPAVAYLVNKTASFEGVCFCIEPKRESVDRLDEITIWKPAEGEAVMEMEAG